MKIRSWLLALTLGVVGTLAAGKAGAVLYSVDFGSPPHTVGQPPVTGAGPAPRNTVSAISSGTPTVAGAALDLADQPCAFSSYDGEGDQLKLDLTDLPSAPSYTIAADVLVAAGDPDGVFSFLFDTPEVRTIHFNRDETVSVFVPGSGDNTIGVYKLGAMVHLDVDIYLELDMWTIKLNGTEFYTGDFGGASALESVRIGTSVVPSPPRCLAAIDNLVITEGAGLADGGCDRLTMGDLVTGTVYNVGDSFLTEGVGVQVRRFATQVGACGAPYSSGTAAVTNAGEACGAGKELQINNVTLDFDFGATVTDVVIPFGEYGGTVSLEINGDCQVVENLVDLSGTSLGGVAITVWDAGVVGQGCGVIRLGGDVSGLAIGGQELYIDGLSYCTFCPELVRSAFDDQTNGSTYHVGDSFTSGGATHTFHNFFWPGATCSTVDPNGVATIGNAQEACGGGKELGLNNINDRIDFGTRVDWLALNYGEYGGNVNLRINGDCRNLDNLSDVNGSTVGGVKVWAIDYGTPDQSCGIFYAIGSIDNFRIGGQEFWIDNVRACPSGTATVMGPLGDANGAIRLSPSWPNPARESATLRFSLASAGHVRMTVYDVGGRVVRTLVDGPQTAGQHDVQWDGNDDRGSRLPAGVYSYRVQSGGSSRARRLVLLP
jgi:hypothetical protein